ncbi:AAA family ATPase [Streptomyces sp. NPDC048330]|uniref:AAA family ATPase n=1 Tax=Streptomyces sp. NPDC048330 TaxID=3365533 RepID=UPI0037102873
MAGLPGSGKTTLSRVLTDRGFVRLCPDEEMFRRHGVYGVDFPRGVFPTLERPVLEDVAVELREHLKSGRDVVVDHGFWTPEDRATWRSIATDEGATRYLSTLLPVMTSCGAASASVTSSMRTTRTRSTSLRAICSAIGRGSSLRRQRNRTCCTRAIQRPCLVLWRASAETAAFCQQRPGAAIDVHDHRLETERQATRRIGGCGTGSRGVARAVPTDQKVAELHPVRCGQAGSLDERFGPCLLHEVYSRAALHLSLLHQGTRRARRGARGPSPGPALLSTPRSSPAAVRTPDGSG